jgi:hypothetical protein
MHFSRARYRQRRVLDVVPTIGSIGEKHVLVVDENLTGTPHEHIARAKDLFRAVAQAISCDREFYCTPRVPRRVWGSIALCIQKTEMLKNADDQMMDALELAEQAKKRNIIDMAVGFTGMMRLFQEGTADLIKGKLADIVEGLDRISSEEEFNKMHRGFCQWFVKTIRLAKTEEPPSYGHAAKVLDLALKVYVYYCNMPSPAKAESLMPRLNGTIGTRILRHLFKKLDDIYGKSYPPHLWTIKMISKEDYDLLQKVIRQDIRDSLDDTISPVQYDDIMWRRLNR